MPDLLQFNPVVEGLPVYQPGRPISEVARELGLDPGEIYKLASNENPLGPSPAALAAIRDYLGEIHLYPDGNAFHLKSALAEKLGVGHDNLVAGSGSNEVLELIAHAFLEPGAEAVVSQYCFAVYPIVTRLMGAALISVPAREFGHDLPAMVRAVTPRTRVMFVANPNNPTGTLASRQEIAELLKDIPDHVLLVLDEAYYEFLDDPIDLVPLVRRGDRPNLFLCRTFSKIHGLAGLRVGYGIGSPQVVRALEKVREPFNVNALAQVAAAAALNDEAHLEATRANNQAGLQFLQSNLRRLQVEYIPSAANFLMIKVGNGRAVFEALQREGVITRPVGGYQLPEWLRVSVGTPEQNRRFIELLKPLLGR